MARTMKDSGIEWIGTIPCSWSCIKNKYLLDGMYSGGTPTASNELFYSDDGIPFVSISDMSSVEYVNDTKKKLTTAGIIDKNLEILPAGTIIYSIYATIGAVAELGIPAAISQAILALKLKPTFDKRYYKYNLQAMRDYIFFSANGNTQSNLNAEKVWNFHFVVPTPCEQSRIACFLDAECARIDAVIEQTRASIAEYKKLKQAVITQAVTKGIRGDRPMKDSGIEWIGEIPAEWRLAKTLYCLIMPITDGPHTTPELFDKGIALISAEAVSCGNGRIDFSHKRGYISQEFYEECCKKYIPQIDDIYMIKSGATTGRVSMVDTLEPVFTIWSPLAVFRCNKEIMLPKFLFYALQSDGFQKQVEFGWTYGTQQNIGMRILEQLKVCLPSVSEQAEIVSNIEYYIQKVEATIITKQQLLTELETYKKSVIYEYVTGKKEISYE